MVKKGESRALNANGPHIDWNVATTSPVKVSPAVTGTDFTTASSSDVFAFGVSNTGTARGINGSGQLHAGWAAAAADAGIFVLTNLYDASTKPDLLTYALDNATTEAFTSGGLVFNIAGTKLYGLTQTGKLRCFAIPAGGPVGGAATRASTCTGWTDYTSNTVSRSSIWPIYDGSGEITSLYFGTNNGRLHKVNGSTGATAWGASGGPLGSPTAQLGPPIVVVESATKNVVFIADNIGRFFRFVDTGSTPSVATTSSYDLCETGPGSCATANWGVLTSPTADISVNQVYVASGGRVFEFPTASTATWAPTNPEKILVASPSAQFYSNPILDPDNSWLYVGFDNKLFKLRYPFDGSSSTNIYSTSLQKAGPDSSYPRGQALAYQGNVWIGSGTGTDGNGIAESYACGATGNATAPARTGQTAVTYGAYVATPLVMDYLTGNVNFGYQNAAGTSGGAVQFKSSGSPDWDCGSQSSISGLACGSSGCGTGCSVAGDCPGTHQSTVSCTAPTCGGTCSAGYADCNANKNLDGCETSTTNDTSNCGGCGTTCSTSNMTPTCSAGSCGGTCNYGYENCNGNFADGCEGGATCSDCCGVACSGGTPVCSSGVCKATPGTVTTAYSVSGGNSGSGNSDMNVGLDFDVVSPIVITSVGVFDHQQNGLNRAITFYLYNRDTQALITSSAFATGSGATLDGDSRFQAPTCPIVLPAGFHGTVAASGWAGNEKYGESATPTWTTSTGGGLISFVGTGRTGTSGTFPTTVEAGPANRFASATFKFAAAP